MPGSVRDEKEEREAKQSEKRIDSNLTQFNGSRVWEGWSKMNPRILKVFFSNF